MSNFEKICLSEIGKTITGKTPSSSCPEDFGNDYLFVTPSDKLEKKYLSKTERGLSKEGFKKLLSKALPPKSILVSCIGSAMGKVTMNTHTAITNQQINSIIVNQKYNSDYVYYCLKNNYSTLRTAVIGSTSVPLLNKTDFDQIKIGIHSKLSIQKKISSILSALDDKIELTNKINAQLEAMAKLLYDYWFVQFDFPDANGKPYKSSGGKMVYNTELKKEIPDGWEVKPINYFIKSDKSGDWGKENSESNYNLEVKCIRGTDINGLNGNEEAKCPTRFILEKNKFKLLEAYDLVIEISGGSPTQSTGRLGYITNKLLHRFDNPLICSNFCRSISLKDKFSFYYFVYTWKKLYNNNSFFGFEGKTSGIKNLLFEALTSHYKIIEPSKILQQNFFNITNNFEKQKQINLKQNQTLASLRDWLLPMLMNGQVTINEAYKMAEKSLSMAAEPEAEFKK